MILSYSASGFIRRLTRSEEGTSILELALAAPLIMTFLVGIIDICMFASDKLNTEQAAYRGLEIIQVNRTVPSIATIKTQVATAAEVDEDDVDVVEQLYCNGVASAATSCASGETTARYMNVEIEKAHSVFLPAMAAVFFETSDNGQVVFTVDAAVRVE